MCNLLKRLNTVAKNNEELISSASRLATSIDNSAIILFNGILITLAVCQDLLLTNR